MISFLNCGIPCNFEMEFGAYCTCKLYKYFCNFVTLIWRKNAKYNERVKTLPLTPTWKILREINLIYSWRNHFTVWKSNTMWLRFILKIQHFFRQINILPSNQTLYTVRHSYLNNHSIKYCTRFVQIWTPHRVYKQQLAIHNT